MKKIDVVVATAQCYINPSLEDWRAIQINQEDMIVVNAFQELGLNAVRKGWDDPDFDWATTKSVLIRTTWNYTKNFKKFQGWLKYVTKHGKLFNSLSIIEWNIHKSYLKYLQERGVNIVPTLYFSSCVSLKNTMEERGWEEIVIKPSVSASAYDTYRISYHNVEEYQGIFDNLVAEKEMMVQPFQKNVLESGEKSCIVLNHRFSHAICKIPKNGDFRVQEVYGGTVKEYHPTEEEKKFSEHAIACAPYDVQYARVDFTNDKNNKPAIMELELIEPELFFRFKPQAAKELAQAVKQNL